MKQNVLVVDEDVDSCMQIKSNLQDKTIEVCPVRSLAEGLNSMKTNVYSLVILDLSYGIRAGIKSIEKIRGVCPVPILALSNHPTIETAVAVLNSGADDFIKKPYPMEEFVARAKALMRRYTELNHVSPKNYSMVQYGDISLDVAKRKVSMSGQEILLTKKEYEILFFLLTHQKEALSYEQIYHAVWKDVFLGDNSTIFYHMGQLRKKLGGDKIESIYGIGYRLRDPKVS